MAPSVAHLHTLVARNAKLIKVFWRQTSRVVQETVQSTVKPQSELRPAFARVARQPVHPIAALKQSKSRYYSTKAINAVRNFTSSATRKPAGVKYDRASFPKSRVGAAVNSLPNRAPFAHTLRPNLSGGTLGRTSGGYGLGGSARYFSHAPQAPAQVVNNVSQAIRAFFISGQKAQYDGINPHTGEKRYKAVTTLQEEVGLKASSLPKATPGSFIDFPVNPTITALTPLQAVTGFGMQTAPKESLNTEGLFDVLSVDFSRALKELSAVLNNLKRLSALGDLPITYQGTSLRIHFPGCDSETVAKLCDELSVSRGVIQQDEDFDEFAGTEIALLFPFTPSKTASECSFFEKPVEERRLRQDHVDWTNMLSPATVSLNSVEEYSTQSDRGLDFEDLEHFDLEGKMSNPQVSSPSGYESLHTSEIEDDHSSLKHQGFEGI